VIIHHRLAKHVSVDAIHLTAFEVFVMVDLNLSVCGSGRPRVHAVMNDPEVTFGLVEKFLDRTSGMRPCLF